MGKRSEGPIKAEPGRGQAVEKSEFLPRLLVIAPDSPENASIASTGEETHRSRAAELFEVS